MSYTPLSFGSGGNVTFGSTGSQITATAPAGGPGGGVALSAGTVAITSGTAVFSNANGVTFGANGQTITASVNTAAGGVALGAGTQTATSGTVSFANSNGVTFGLISSNGQITGSVNEWLVSAGTRIIGSGLVNFSNANGVTFGMDFFNAITASHNGLTSQSNQAVSAANGSSAFQTLSFANSNGVSFSTGTQGLFASHNGLTSQSNQAFSASGGSSAFQTLNFANSNGLTFSNNAGSVVASYTVPSTAGLLSAIRLSAGTSSANLSAVTFDDGGNVAFGLNGSVVTAAYNQTKPNVGVSGDASSAYVGDIVSFVSSHDIRWPVDTLGRVIAQPVQRWSAVGNTTNASTMQQTGLAYQVSGAGVASVGFAGAALIVSVPAGGGGLTNINVSAGTTSQNLSNLVFSNGGNVSFGLNGSTVTASAPSGGGGAVVSMYPALPHAWATSSMYTGASTTVGGGSSSTLSFYVSPLVLDAGVTFNNVAAMISAANASGTGTGSHRHVLGIYTRNGNTLSKLTQFAFNAIGSFSSSTAQTLSFWAGDFAGSTAASTSRISGNVSASITGLRLVNLNATSSATSLSAGQYFLAHAYNHRTTGAATMAMGTAWRYSVSQFTAGIGFSNTTGPAYCECNGIVSTVTTASQIQGWDAPPSISLGAITANGGTSQNQWPLVILRSVTA